ncbi:PrgI family protein [Frankia sp. CiP3]|uniref:PrgI family protein n=1 Tax=Frankia sp. CiP3 TaxID=2880971 RepID=UPI001EF5D4C4|nr:PrgI family protein [Frankia sp. CiP3]
MTALRPPATAVSAGRVRIPADVDRPDRILAGLTARQLLLLAPTLLTVTAVYQLAAPALPLPLIAMLIVPILAAGTMLAVGQHGGLPADRYVAAALTHRRAPKQQVPAPHGVPALPGWLPTLGPDGHRQPTPARPLAAGVDTAGMVDLGADGVAVLAEVDAVNTALGNDHDRQLQVAVFTGMLNALSGPIQITVRAAPVRLDPHLDRLHALAPGLPHPALETAAVDHATFLADLAGRRTLLTRQILLTAREPIGPGTDRTVAAGRALRRLEEAAGLLAAAGVGVRICDADTVTVLLATLAHPTGLPPTPGVTAAGTITAPDRGDRQ